MSAISGMSSVAGAGLGNSAIGGGAAAAAPVATGAGASGGGIASVGAASSARSASAPSAATSSGNVFSYSAGQGREALLSAQDPSNPLSQLLPLALGLAMMKALTDDDKHKDKDTAALLLGLAAMSGLNASGQRNTLWLGGATTSTSSQSGAAQGIQSVPPSTAAAAYGQVAGAATPQAGGQVNVQA